MNLREALQPFEHTRYYTLCGYSYHGLLDRHKDLTFAELQPNMQRGIIVMIMGLYRVQKMVYCYDLEYVNHCIKDCGVKLKPFYDGCEISRTFYRARSLSKNPDERLMCIRLRLIDTINGLFDYVLKC